ncbi:hypothetical protein IFT66_06935 [Rhizobium sp. CFBP 13726]|uniref:hypothetical protein n=1 Tax=Rhizobium sp. CFBP 13726 TaxID=2775296 RepID=UPI00177CAC3F|nr:hypothetical protein [Rhizobium sp. CFBP 13726]MBD8650811.1 hypothetical protein [Rhizobium sp. CFBP 13726]
MDNDQILSALNSILEDVESFEADITNGDRDDQRQRQTDVRHIKDEVKRLIKRIEQD